MERYGVVLVAAFAAGMFAGPLFCVIYSRLRQNRKLQPGPRQLKSAQRQLVSLAEYSTRLGAQKWEMAIATSSGAVGADDQAGPRPGRWLRGSEPGGGEQEEDGIGHPHRPRGGAGDDAADCPICIGPLFPQGRDNGEEASDNRLSAAYASSTQACIDRDTSNGVADGGRDRWWITTWRTWSRSLRRQPGAASSTLPPPQPEMSSARQGWDGRQDSLAWGVQSRGGEALDPQGGDGEGSRVQSGDPEKMACSRGSDHDDTPDSTTTTVEGGAAPRRRDGVMTTSPRSGAQAGAGGAAVPGWSTGGSQDGNVLEGIHDSDAKAMTPVYLATSSTGSQSPGPAPSDGVGGGDAKTGRLDTQPLAGHAAVLTAPCDGEAARSPPQSSDRRAVGARDDVQTTTTLAGSTESGRLEPSTISAATPTHPAPTLLNTPRRPANAVVRASRAAVALMGNLSPSSRRARAAASSHDGAGHDHEHDGDDDSNNNGTSDIDTDILVLRGCQHAFHARCLVTWFLADGFDCPVCRTPYWMHRERLARALQNERNGLPLNHNEEQFQARARAHWAVASPSVYSAMGSAFVVVRTPGRPVYATDRRPWEVYIP